MLLGYASQLPKAFLDNFDEIIFTLTHSTGQFLGKSYLILFQANLIHLNGDFES